MAHAINALCCSAMQEAESNAKLLTPALLQSLYIQAIANNTKLYFGEKIPGMLLDQRCALHNASMQYTCSPANDLTQANAALHYLILTNPGFWVQI